MYNFSINFNGPNKRVLCFETEYEKKICLETLKQTINYRECQNFYRLDYQNVIGQGTYGVVYKSYCKLTGKTVAIKVLSKEEMTVGQLDRAMSEYSILQACNKSPHIVQLLDVFEDQSSIYIVTEFIQGSSLIKIVQAAKSEQIVKLMAVQLFEGLAYLQDMGVVHRDIKHENIMASVSEETDEVTLKFIDFGFAQVMYQEEYADEMFGTLAYCSPEILLGLQHNLKTDVWSLGVVIYELLSGKFPFVGEEKGATKKNIATATLNLNTVRWSSISSEAIDLIKKMLNLDEDSRISASQLLHHSWFL